MCALLVLSGTTALGQVAAPPQVDLRSNQPSGPTPAPQISPEVPDISQLDEAFRETSLGKQADERRLHVEIRKLANEVENNSDIVAARAAAEHARTDLEKRQRLRDYYDLFYGRISAKAGSDDLKRAIDAEKRAHIGRTAQPRVRHETDGALSTPPPAAADILQKHKQKHKKKKRSP